MSYPGPWEQGPDYQRTDGTATMGGWRGEATTNYPDAPPYDDEMNAALAAVAATTAGSIGLGASLGVTATTGTTSPATVYFTTKKTEGAAQWTAANILDTGYYVNNIIARTAPADAVGVELEGSVVTVTGAALHLVANTTASDATIPSNVVATPNVGLAVEIVANRASLTTFTASGTPQHLAFDFDLSATMGPSGECQVDMTASQAGDWAYYNPNNRGQISCGVSVPLGVGATLMTYTLHPPRHRWLYNTPPVPPGLPPLRQHPRRDGLGASTARRHYPPDRSVQASNRRAGGYY